MTGHTTRDTHERPAGHGSVHTNGQGNSETQLRGAVGVEDQRNGSQSSTGAHNGTAADALILIAADILDDLERVRIATENRLRSLTHEEVLGERGGWFGKGLDPDMREVRQVEAILANLRQLEHQAELDLCRAMRAHPLGDWVKRTVGVGEKQAARLLAAIGDPASRRTVSQLWAYCGFHVLPAMSPTNTQMSSAGNPTDQMSRDTHSGLVGGESLGPSQASTEPHFHRAGVESLPASQPCRETQSIAAGGNGVGDHPNHNASDTHCVPVGVAPKRRKGQKANWSNTAKMRARLIAESCIKQRHSPYRLVYDQRREHTATTHPEWTPIHSHNDGLRIAAKAMLKDLWIEARQTISLTKPTDPSSGGLDSADMGQDKATAKGKA